MIIILEGPDGSGKSMLAKQIAAQNKYPLIHRVAPETQADCDMMFHSYWNEMTKRKNLVYDRAFYSDMVYGPVFRGGASITYPNMYDLERHMAKVGGMIIYCTAPFQTLWNRCQERDEDNPGGTKFEQDRDKMYEVWSGFERLMNVPHLIPVVRYEYQDL